MSDTSAGQGYSSQDDGLTSYPGGPGPHAPIPRPPISQPYGQPPMPQQTYPQPYMQGSPYPAPGGAHPVVESGPRIVPQGVQIAFYVMLAGALVTLLSLAYSLTMLDEARSDALDASGGVLRGDELDLVVYASIGGAVVSSLVMSGLWVWMAFVCRAGKNWGRITGTVFFGINVLFYVGGMVSAFVTSTVGLALVFSTATLAIGLAAVILLWTGMSKPFFAPRAPQGYQPYPGYPPTAPY